MTHADSLLALLTLLLMAGCACFACLWQAAERAVRFWRRESQYWRDELLRASEFNRRLLERLDDDGEGWKHGGEAP